MFKHMFLLAAVSALPMLAGQDIRVRPLGEGRVEAAPQAEPAQPDRDPAPVWNGDNAELHKLLSGAQAVPVPGELNADERAALEERARARLERDLARLEQRERTNAREPNRPAQARESTAILRDRYRASLRGLERDLLYRLAKLRRPGGDRFEGPLDDLQDKIKDTYADLHDKVDDGAPVTWETTLDVARKFHSDFLTQIEKWAKEIGVDAGTPDAVRAVGDMRNALLARVRAMRQVGGRRYEEVLDGLEDRIKDTFADLHDKAVRGPAAGGAEVIATAGKFRDQFNAELDQWAAKLHQDDALPRPTEQLAVMARELTSQIDALRSQNAEGTLEGLDALENRVRDSFAALRERVLNLPRENWPALMEEAQRLQRDFSNQLEGWRARVDAANAEAGPRPHDPAERDLKLPPGVHHDVTAGARVARVGPLVRTQLGIDNGLEVKEITDADAALPRAGIEVYDIILKVNDVTLDTRSGLRETMDGIEGGAEFKVEVIRRGKRVTLSGRK